MENRHSSPPNSGGEGAWQGEYNQALGLLSVGGRQKPETQPREVAFLVFLLCVGVFVYIKLLEAVAIGLVGIHNNHK